MAQTQLPLPLTPEVSVTTVLLVDFENVRDLPLASLSLEWEVIVFVGRSQNNIPFELATRAQLLGTRLRWIKIEGDGRNNLDFHLAYYLGVASTANKHLEYLVLTRDKGFDPLIRHLTSTGLDCKRIESLPAVSKEQPSTGDPNFERAYKVLAGLGKKTRPRKRQTLKSSITSIFQNKQPGAEVERILDILFTEKLVSEANNALTYYF